MNHPAHGSGRPDQGNSEALLLGDREMFNNLVTRLVVKTQSVVNSRIAREETGATAVEYGLIVGLIAVAIVVAITLVGTNLNTIFGTVNTKLGSVAH